MGKNKKIKLMIIITMVLILIDQVTKIMVQMMYQNPLQKGILGITLIQNTGMAFGLNSGNTKNIVLTILVLLIVINFIRRQKDKLDTKTAVSISLILAGGISNLIDRIMRGGIIDFIKIENFAIFNIADCYIVMGWVLFVICLVKFNKEMVGGKNCEKQ